jgi:hypothetical protein
MTKSEPRWPTLGEARAADAERRGRGEVSLNLYREGITGSLQLSIDFEHREGGHGYRLFGEKFVGQSKRLRHYVLTEADIDAIRAYLRLAKRRLRQQS